jgi:hypothetical protein
MKKQILLVLGFIFVVGFCVLSCDKKKSDSVSPTYGSTGNPNPNNPTVTGNVTPTNPATRNTGMTIGGSGWSNLSCGTTNSISLKGSNGKSDVTLSFASIINTGTYAVGSTPGPSVCAMTLINPDDQPAGIVWYGRSGIVSVVSSTSGINASFSNVVCTQQNFNFPTVSATGFIGCIP